MRWGLLLWLCVACRPGSATRPATVVDAAGYATACARDDECAAVFFGDVCDCMCANAAITTRELPRYRTAAAAAGARCAARRMCKCLAREAICTAGQCALR